jgi:hypothetical protein
MAKSSKNNAAGAATGQINAVLEGSGRPPEAFKIVLRPLESLVPYARNPRAHSEEQVAQIASAWVSADPLQDCDLNAATVTKFLRCGASGETSRCNARRAGDAGYSRR